MRPALDGREDTSGRLAASPVVFVLASVVLCALLVPGAFLRGEVLSQGTLLYQHQPWQAHAPDDLRPANPLLHDAAYHFYPLLAHAVETVRRGELPIWSTALYGGHPYLASFQTALFSPFTLVALIVPLPHATTFRALAPLVVGGLGMFLFIRGLGLNTVACWLAGLAYLLNGFAVGWMEHPLTAVASWLPWLLHGTERLLRSGQPRDVPALAAFVALTIVAGHPETTAKVLALTGAYAAVGLAVRRSRRWVPFAAAYGAGVLLTAVQLLPFYEYLSNSETLLSRQAQPLNTYFLPPPMLIAGLVPDFFGNPAFGPHAVPPNPYGVTANYTEGALYAGIAILFLAAIALAARAREPRVRFFTGAALLALALMFGLPGVIHAVSAFPLLRVMILTRFGLVVITSVIVLAAYGVDCLTRTAQAEKRAVGGVVAVVTCAAIAAMAVAWIVSTDFLHAHGLTASATRGTIVAAVLIAGAGALILLRASNRLSIRAFALAICALVAGDLLAAGRGVHPTVPAPQVYPPVPEIETVRGDPGLFRVYGWDNALVPNSAAAYGLQDARGWDGMNPHRWTRLLDLGYLRQTSDPARHLANPVILDLLNVKYVFADAAVPLPSPRFTRMPEARAPIYVNTRALPRAFLVGEYRVLDDEGIEAALHDPSVDPGAVVLLEEDLPEAERPERTAGLQGTVDVRHYRDTYVEMAVDTPARALLVMSDAWYPGWTAAVDGQPVRIRRANYALRAIAVPAGRHVVRFEYRPRTLRVGAAVSALTLAGLFAVVAIATRARPHAET